MVSGANGYTVTNGVYANGKFIFSVVSGSDAWDASVFRKIQSSELSKIVPGTYRVTATIEASAAHQITFLIADLTGGGDSKISRIQYFNSNAEAPQPRAEALAGTTNISVDLDVWYPATVDVNANVVLAVWIGHNRDIVSHDITISNIKLFKIN